MTTNNYVSKKTETKNKKRILSPRKQNVSNVTIIY